MSSVGPLAATLLFGPVEVGDFAILRVYAWHVIFLPSLLIVTMIWHFWKIRRDAHLAAAVSEGYFRKLPPCVRLPNPCLFSNPAPKCTYSYCRNNVRNRDMLGGMHVACLSTEAIPHRGLIQRNKGVTCSKQSWYKARLVVDVLLQSRRGITGNSYLIVPLSAAAALPNQETCTWK